MVNREIREKARQLRQEGTSVRDISKKLAVSRGSVSSWVRDIQLTETQIEALRENQRHYRQQNKGAQSNRERFRLLRCVYQEEGRVRAQENRPLHQAGCMLYWAEGAKERNGIYFVNSDPYMLRMFMRFLREEMLVSDDRITLYIHCHFPDVAEQRRVEQFWVAVLGLQETCLRKTQVKKGSNTRKNILYNGVCGIRVARSTRLVQHIYGAIQAYAEFENPAWLF